MRAADHSRELEQVMAYVDGGLDAAAAESVRAHLATCSDCRQAERDLRDVSERLQTWEVGEPPEGLRPPAFKSTPSWSAPYLAWMFTTRGLMATAAGVVLLVIGASLMQVQQRRDEAPMQIALGSESATTPPAPFEQRSSARVGGELQNPNVTRDGVVPQGAVSQGPMIVRNARLTIVASDYDAARVELERVVQQAGGFIGSIVAHGASGSSRRLEATLRVPTAKLDETVAALRKLGQVVAEAQDGEDVTQQSADLDTRLENARVSEKRLRDILALRTGKLADVLDVEREIARVRGEIEQMESERRSLDRRVTYATLTVSLSEDRKSEVNLGPVPVSRRFRNAFVEGWTNAIGGAVDATLFLVRIAPSLLLWAVVLVPAALIVRRRYFRAG